MIDESAPTLTPFPMPADEGSMPTSALAPSAIPTTTQPIHCSTSGKLLARRDYRGMWLWCKACRCEHFHTWEILQTFH